MLLKSLLTLLSILIVSIQGSYVTYRPSLYGKSAHYSLKVNGTYMDTVNYAGYDYVQLSMDEGHPTEFRIAVTDQAKIDTYTISPRQLPIKPTVSGKELIFSVVDAHYLIVKINDEKELVILADPTETDVPNPSASNVYNVLNYGADNKGTSVTKGIQSAMDAAEKHPGSIVYVPPGVYLMGNLRLRNQTSLYLAGGSVLRFTAVATDYKTLFNKSDLFYGTWWIQTDIDTTDIKVYGRGTIDGNGYNTRQAKYLADLLVPVGTKNFKCDGVLVRDSSFWAVVPIQVEDALLTNIKILDRFDVTQDDGIDVCESQRVTVRRAIAIANDDSFSTKTWPYNTGTTVPYPYAPRPLSDVVFDNCLAWTDCYGYKVGQGVFENQDDVTFQNSVVYNAGVGIGIDHKFGNQTANNINFDTIDIEALHGNSGGQATWLSVFVENVKAGVGNVTNLTVKNIRARAIGARNGFLQGFNASSIVKGVTLSDIYIGTSTTPATSLKQMKLLNTTFSEDIKIVNS